MERSLVHRGPDEGNIWSDDVCGLVHRRLRVIDLSDFAAQPMVSESGVMVLVFNGEVYNFRELRAELEKYGRTFRGTGDTEVLLQGYETWGESLFPKLKGMFAFAIWNRQTKSLILVRDGFGKKPLYYFLGDETIVFGSELTAFRGLPQISRSISPSAFREYLEFGYVCHPRTIFREIQQLPPGCCGVWNEAGWQTSRYFVLPSTAPEEKMKLAGDQASEAVEEALRRSVETRLISDVPLGCFLSGGIDSSLIAALAQQATPGQLKTFTVGFQDIQESEAGSAAAVARHLGTDHHEIIVSGDSLIEDFVEIFAKASEPLGDDSFLPTYVIARETKREVTVSLSGDGGDELFCGYEKYRQFAAGRKLQDLLPRSLLQPLSSVVNAVGSDALRKRFEAVSTQSPAGLARWLSTLWKQNELDLLMRAPAKSETEDAFDRAWHHHEGFSGVERLMLTDLDTYLVSDILAKVDRASMAVGLEVRSPFLDDDFVAVALDCPSRTSGKEILKQILARHLPRGWFERPKQGFGMPIDRWYRGPLRELLLTYTEERRIAARGLIDPKHLQRVVADHLSGRRNFARKLHAVVAFEIWADHSL